MSQDAVDIEECTQLARQISISADEVEGSSSSREPSRSFYDTNVGKGLVVVAYIIPLIWCTNKISTDPLSLYFIVIDDSGKCFRYDHWPYSRAVNWFLNPFGIAVNVIFMGSLVMRVGLLKKYEKIIWLPLLLFDLWAYIWPYFHFKQILTVAWPNGGVKNFYSASIYLLQYFSTVILIYIAFTRATRTSATLTKAIWAKAAFNLVLYIYGGHVFGGLWYAFAIEKQIDCWVVTARKQNDSKCSWNDFFCGDYGHSDCYNFTKLDEVCRIKTSSTTIYDFGIYSYAVKSGILLKERSLSKKVLYCLRWGLQNLSGFGQNLEVSTDPWENIFVISIVIYSLMLFVFFIGNLQMYLQSETIKSGIARQKKLEIEHSKSFAKLPKNLQKQIKRYQPNKWEEIKGAEFENLFNNLPGDIKKNIKRELCLGILQTVEEFQGWSKELLDELCDCAKVVSYTEYAQIVQKDNSIDKMLLVVHGKLQIYSFTSIYTSSTNMGSSSTNGSDSIAHSNVIINHLGDGELCGEELVNWFQLDPYSSNLPISTKIIEAVTKVDGFALMYYSLKNAFIKHQTTHRSMQDQEPPAES